MVPPPKAVTVLGGGLTSLAFAYRLSALSPSTKITLLEAAPRLGGWLSTVSLPLPDGQGAVQIEEGPRSVRPKGRGAPRLLGMVQELGLQDSVVTVGKDHPSAQNRFLVHPTPGALLKLPSSPTSLLTTTIGRALALAAAKEPFQPVSAATDESVDSFFRRRFGATVADSVASAMVHGIYACSSKDLSVRSAFPYLFYAERARGSVIKALVLGLPKSDAEALEDAQDKARWAALGDWGKELQGQSVWGLKGGLGTLTAVLQETLSARGVDIRLGEAVKAMALAPGGVQITTTHSTHTAPSVVSSLPPHILSKLLPPGHALPHLNANPLTTVSVLTFVFPAASSGAPSYHPAGFGYLIPRSTTPNDLGVLGCVFDSTAMGAADTPDVQSAVVKYTMMIGGPYYTSGAVAIPADARSLVGPALAHLRSTLPDLPQALEPLAVYANTHKDCIPTYTPGHGSRMRDVHEALAGGEWKGRLAVGGAGWGGVSLGDCTENGGSLAEQLLDAGAANVTGLERWKAWDAYAGRAQPTSLPIDLPQTRPFSTSTRSSRTRPMSCAIRRPSARGYATSSPVPPRPQAPLAIRATASILGFILLLYLIWFGIVIVANGPYILKEIYGAMKGNEVKEWKRAEGEKEIMLDDVKGMGEVKDEVREFIEFLKNPDMFASLGGRPTKGVLLSGPPGTGKTMLARAIAGEAGVPFFYASGSEFEDTYVGVGAMRIRQMFKVAKERAPSIIFIDELDSIGSKRSDNDGENRGPSASGGGGADASKRQTLNELLAQLDGFSSDEDVIVVAATNFPESLDEALIRPGRFDRHVHVPLPDVQGRLEILKHYAARLIVDPKLDLTLIARGTPGLSGADLENLANLAAIRASKEGDTAVRLSHMDWARDRLLMGAERRSRFVSDDSLRMSAYIEAGRALIANETDGSVPLHKVSLLPRGSKLSITSQVPGMDQDSISRKEYIARIDVAVAGRIAEELLNGADHLSDRTAEDLDRASKIADAMVREMGFSEKVGLVSINRDQMPWLSKAKKSEIESETQRLVEESAHRSRQIMQAHRADLDRLAAALIQHETLSAHEIKAVLEGRPINPPVPWRKDEKVKPPAALSKAGVETPPEAKAGAGAKPVQWLRDDGRVG